MHFLLLWVLRKIFSIQSTQHYWLRALYRIAKGAKRDPSEDLLLGVEYLKNKSKYEYQNGTSQ